MVSLDIHFKIGCLLLQIAVMGDQSSGKSSVLEALRLGCKGYE